MGLISKLFRRGASQADIDFKNNLVLSAAQGEAARGDTESDLAWKNLMAFRYEVIHDEDIEDILSQKCMKPTFIPKVDEKGAVAYAQDEAGNIVTDGAGQPVIQYERVFQIDNAMAALRNMLSHTNRLTFLNPKNKRYLELIVEDLCLDVEMNMPEDEFDSSVGAYLDSLQANMVMLLNDAENGNKVKAMLENRTTKNLDLTVGQPQKQKGAF
jgi:hypothetical protein